MKLLSSLFFLAIVPFAASRASDKDFLDQAKVLLAQQKYSDALSALDNAIQVDNNNYLSWFKRATTYLLLGQTQNALKDFTQVLSLKPDFDQVLLQRGKIFLQEGEFDSSITDFKKYLTSNQNDQSTHELLKQATQAKLDLQVAHDNLNNHDVAIEHFGKVLSIAPHFVDVRMKRGDLFLAKRDFEMAAGDFIRASNLKPNNLAALLKLTDIRVSLGEISSAIASLKECLRFDPDNKKCKPKFRELKKIDKKIERMKDLKNKKLWRKLILHIHGEGQEEGLLSAIEKKEIGGSLPLEMYEASCIGYSEWNLKQNEKIAFNWCSKTLEVDSNNIEANYWLGELKMLSEDYEDAMRFYKASHEASGGSNSKAAEGYQKAQRLHRQQGQKNYYKILGVSRDASKREIKKSFRSLAKIWHPDKYEGEDKEKAMKKYHDINEAYEILNDDEKRQQFDNGIDPNNPNGGQGGHGAHHMYQEFFQGGSPFGGHPGGGFQFKFNF